MEKLYLVFWEGDGCSRESASAYYTNLVQAKSSREAKIKILPYVEKDFESVEQWEEELSEYGTQEITIIK
jgi:hypothetical protein